MSLFDTCFSFVVCTCGVFLEVNHCPYGPRGSKMFLVVRMVRCKFHENVSSVSLISILRSVRCSQNFVSLESLYFVGFRLEVAFSGCRQKEDIRLTLYG